MAIFNERLVASKEPTFLSSGGDNATEIVMVDFATRLGGGNREFFVPLFDNSFFLFALESCE